MHVREIDYRSTHLRTLCTVSTNAISELVDFSKNGVMDGLTVMEYIEYFLGAVFVACQAYAVGTVSDINQIQKTNYRKIDLYKHQKNSNQEHTLVELINALANFFKHNEEWTNWPENETTKVLRYFSINEDTELPLNFGLQSIIGDSKDLRGIC